MGGPSKITVQMMSGDITEVSASTLADLREAIGRMLQTCPEFVRVLHDEALLEESVDVSSLREVTVTALVTPSVPNVLKALRQSGFSFRGLNEKSTSASKTRGLNVLHAAVMTGKLDIVQFLLLEEDFVGVNDLCCDGSGYTALHLAASHGLVDACRELLDCPQVTHQDEHSVKDGTALHIAASAGHAGVVQLLLDSERFTVVNAVVVADQWPLLINMASACGPPQEAAESKHIITQDSWRLVKIEPEVQDIADHFGLDERITGKLQEALNTRPDPGTDLQVMWEILDEARNPPGLTMIKVKEMLDGTFRAGEQKDAGVQSLAEKFKLDERAAYKLSEVLSTKPKKKDVLKALDIHLAASNNPSALVMLKLADLRKDVPLGEVPYGTKGYRDRPYLGNYDRDGRRIGRAEDPAVKAALE
ncbi:Anks1b [Symbiodinium pilosum]|uniref:Anks1b protein n=1 Tax=Symbiodinium pilosum TaxID=2952 RepID=A0A812RMB2_SYMPI|nr:Anks1b [Symbiodinium pilosum]